MKVRSAIIDMKVIPSLNFSDEASVRVIMPKLELLKKMGARVVHIDVSDGRFTEAVMPLSPQFFDALLGSDFDFEIHVMTHDPLAEMKRWSASKNVKRFVVHIESDFNLGEAEKACSSINAELVFAMGIGGEMHYLFDLVEMTEVDMVEFVAVPLGFSGGTLDESVLGRIKFFTSAYPAVEVFVDGGVNEHTARMMKDAGAAGLISGSYLWKSDEIEKVYNGLTSL